MDWTGLAQMDPWLSYCLKTGEVFVLAEDRSKPGGNHPLLDGHAPLIKRPLPARAVYLSVDWLLSMNDARAESFGSDGTPGLAFGVARRAWPNDELDVYPDDNDDND